MKIGPSESRAETRYPADRNPVAKERRKNSVEVNLQIKTAITQWKFLRISREATKDKYVIVAIRDTVKEYQKRSAG